MKSILSGGAAALFAFVSVPGWAQDPVAVGPHSVLTAEYNRGDAAFTCPPATDCDVPDAEVRAEVYYPSDLDAGPFPLVVFLHGRHSPCYDPTTGTSSFGAWSQGCDPPFEHIPSYRGYDYIGRVLASHGYIVASIGANGINAQDAGSANDGIVARAHLIETHLGIWNEFNTSGSPADGGPFASDLVGAVDLSNVGTMGHSRGGDGVVKRFARFANSSPFTVNAVLPIAPTNFSGEVITDVDLGVLLPYCDGDVVTLEGSLFYDRARYLLPNDESTKHTFLSLGSNHNFFNTAWTPECWTNPGACWSEARGAMPTPATVDDVIFGDPFCDPTGAASGRLSAAEQRTAGLAYVSAFFRYHLGGEVALLPFLRGDVAPPAGLPADDLYAAYHPPASRRLDLNRLDTAAELTQTTLVGDGGVRGAVIANSLETYERCGFDGSTPCFPGSLREVHWSSFANLDPRLSRVRNSWNAPTDSFVNELPPGRRDVSGYDVLQFRVGNDFTDSDNPSPLVFSVTLDDGTNSSTVLTTSQLGSDDLYLPPGDFYLSTVMNTLRLPLSLFSGVDLNNIQSVAFDYNETPNGTVLLADIAFVDDEEAAPNAPGCQAGEAFIVGSAGSVTTPDGSPGVHSSGTGVTRIDASAETAGIISVGAVQIGSSAVVSGDVLSAGAVTLAGSASVSGTVTQFGSVSLPPLPTLPEFPPPVGPNRFVNPGATLNLAPGSYPTVTVNSGGVLQLSGGDYFFSSLAVNGAAIVRVTPATRVFVQNSLTYRAPFVSASGVVVPIFLGYAGAADLRMEAGFDGTLVAPNAHVFFGIGSGLTFTGSFFARILEVNPQSDLVCIASGGGSATCGDGAQNGSETDVDCGGGDCAACSNGSSCSAGTDCVSGTCTGGICVQPPAPLTAIFETVANWPGGYCVNLSVTNGGTLPTSNWGVTLNTNASTIYTSWNATFSGNSGVVTVAPLNWNRVVAPGATNSSVGFCANRTTAGSGVLPSIVSTTASF